MRDPAIRSGKLGEISAWIKHVKSGEHSRREGDDDREEVAAGGEPAWHGGRDGVAERQKNGWSSEWRQHSGMGERNEDRRAGGRRQHGQPTGMEEERHNAPEEVEEPECLDDHARERPLGKDKQDATEEAEHATQLLLAREEVERLVGPDDERQPGDKQDLHDGVVGRVAPVLRLILGRRRGGPTFPSAWSAPSKKSMTPRSMKSVPNVVSAAPISTGWSVRWQAAVSRRRLTLCFRELHDTGEVMGKEVEGGGSSEQRTAGVTLTPPSDSFKVTRCSLRAWRSYSGHPCPAQSCFRCGDILKNNAQFKFAHNATTGRTYY